MKVRIDDIVSNPEELVARLNSGEEKDKTERRWRLEMSWGSNNAINPCMPTYHSQSAFQ